LKIILICNTESQYGDARTPKEGLKNPIIFAALDILNNLKSLKEKKEEKKKLANKIEG